MIVSDSLKYVYIGIPRTGSKSMNHWLIEYFDGRSCGPHHSVNVPDEFRDYLIFTIVRNPYDLWVSHAFAASWGGPKQYGVKDHEVEPGGTSHEQRMKRWAVLETRDKLVREIPEPKGTLQDMIRQAQEDVGDAGLMSGYLEAAGVKLTLYFERLPDCLEELPFVEDEDIPPFYHHPERGYRPQGTFFDLFPEGEEEVVWAVAAPDFAVLHYRRGELGLPSNAPNAHWLDP